MLSQTKAAVFVENHGFYIPSSDINALFFVDTKGNSKCIGSFLGGIHSNSWKISASFYDDDYIYFFSEYYFEVWRLNRTDETLEHFEYYTSKAYPRIFTIEKNNDSFYVFVGNTDIPIIQIDKSLKRVELINWESEQKNIVLLKAISYENSIYFGIRNYRQIQIGRLNTENNVVEYMDILEADYIQGMGVDKKGIVILYRNNQGDTILERRDFSNTIEKKICLTREIPINNDILLIYTNLFLFNEYIIFFSVYAPQIYIINLSDYSVDVKSYYKRLMSYQLDNIQLKDNCFIISASNGGVYINYGLEADCTTLIPINIDETIFKNQFQICLNKDVKFISGDYLSYLMEYLMDFDNRGKRNGTNNVGEKIYTFLNE